MEVSGYCDEKFAQVREEFEKNFTERGDVGGSFAATIEGEYVVDLWGGHRNAEKSLPWESDTLVNVYSTTKTMTFLASLILADRGELDLYARVADYWPEFAQNGKQDIRFTHLLSHSAGLAGFSDDFAPEDLFNWDAAVDDLARQAPWWEPGTQSGYHAATQGFLIGEVVRRITGQSFGQWFKQNVAEPLAADFIVGVDPADFPRLADMVPDSSADGSVFDQLDPDSMTRRVFSSALNADVANSPEWRQAEIPAGNGHGNARSVVKAQSALANDGYAFGQQLLSAAGAEKSREVVLESTDLVLMFPIKFAMGYAYGNEFLPIAPNPNSIWWAGLGGSTCVIDKDNRTCFSYVMNQAKSAMVGDERSGSLSRALYQAI
ncbi:MAG: serine hydrolase domain-containing protein [Pseudomonadales bacterium]